MKWIVDEQYSQNKKVIADVLREYLNIILMEDIRMKLGNTYSIKSYTDLNILLGELSLDISFSCDPKKVDESIDEIIKDINAMTLGNNINQDILSKAKKACKKIWENSIQNNFMLANNYADLVVIYNKPFDSIDELPKLYNSVTSKDLQEVVNKLLKGGYTSVILYSEKKKRSYKNILFVIMKLLFS
jgi:predicted Zn-dependent peptidase